MNVQRPSRFAPQLVEFIVIAGKSSHKLCVISGLAVFQIEDLDSTRHLVVDLVAVDPCGELKRLNTGTRDVLVAMDFDQAKATIELLNVGMNLDQ